MQIIFRSFHVFTAQHRKRPSRTSAAGQASPSNAWMMQPGCCCNFDEEEATDNRQAQAADLLHDEPMPRVLRRISYEAVMTVHRIHRVPQGIFTETERM